MPRRSQISENKCRDPGFSKHRSRLECTRTSVVEAQRRFDPAILAVDLHASDAKRNLARPARQPRRRCFGRGSHYSESFFHVCGGVLWNRQLNPALSQHGINFVSTAADLSTQLLRPENAHLCSRNVGTFNMRKPGRESHEPIKVRNSGQIFRFQVARYIGWISSQDQSSSAGRSPSRRS